MESTFVNEQKFVFKDKNGEPITVWINIKTVKNVERLIVPKGKVILSRNSEEIEELESPTLNKDGMKTVLQPYYNLVINSPNVRLENYPEIMKEIGIKLDKKTRKADVYTMETKSGETFMSFEEARYLALKWIESLKKTSKSLLKIKLSGTTEQKGSTVN